MNDLSIREVNCGQLTDEWFNARKGVITASRMNDVVNHKTVGHHRYAVELAYERLENAMIDHYVTSDMERGLNNEGVALSAYKARVFDKVIKNESFFIRTVHVNSDSVLIGATPDAIIEKEEREVVEIKCPRLEKYLMLRANLRKAVNDEERERVVKDYIYQVKTQLYVLGLSTGHLILYYDGVINIDEVTECKISLNEKDISLIETSAYQIELEVRNYCKLLGES